jgi:lipoprotein-anchoring transpeptidase ErfK/SrfK
LAAFATFDCFIVKVVGHGSVDIGKQDAFRSGRTEVHSIKNMVVAVCLLAVSFGLYQVSLTPSSEENVESLEAPPAAGQLAESLPAPVPPQKSVTAPSLPAPGIVRQPDELKSPLLADSMPAGPPLDPPNSGGRQKIEYPAAPGADNHEFGGAPTERPKSTPAMAQRELMDPSADAGLIEALQQQSNYEAALNSPGQNPQASPPLNDFSSPTATGKNADHAAQPIGTTDPEFGGMSSHVATTGADSSESKTYDSGVRQADREPDLEDLDFNAAVSQADQLISLEQYREALQLLSRFYRDESLIGPQRQRLMGYLDALAGKVIFSEEDHLVPSPHMVGVNESLADIAAKWKIPAQLIFNVNKSRIPNPAVVSPGTPLKQISGPFRAEVSLRTNEMTLFLGDLYAGRFPVRMGVSGQPQAGDFTVLIKSDIGHTWRDAEGNDYPPGTPENGYGPHWIGLTGSLCIHAVDDSATTGHHGCIGLSHADAKDVFAILAENSEVKIVR